MTLPTAAAAATAAAITTTTTITEETNPPPKQVKRSSMDSTTIIPTATTITSSSSSTSTSSISTGEKDKVEVLGDDDKVEFNDPAILDVKYNVRKRYDMDELIRIRTLPLSNKRPSFLDTAYDSNGTWDPQLWYYNKKSTDVPTENNVRQCESDNHRRRSGDPRERLRKEQDGIVLSPQRRSFISGCYVPGRDNRNTNNTSNTNSNNNTNRPHSPLSGKTGEGSHIAGHREIPTSSTRRIGSGRILPWGDYQEKNEMDNEFGYRRDRRDSDRDDRYERRSFGRDFDMIRGDKEKERHISRNGRYGNSGNDRRRLGNDIKEEEPEWFTGGPISQTDTIELRGFEDGEKGGKRKQSAAQKKKTKERNIVVKITDAQRAVQPEQTQQQQQQQLSTKEEEHKSETNNRVKHTPPPQEPENTVPNKIPSPPTNEKETEDEQPKDAKKFNKELKEQPSLDLEDIFKCDSLTGFYTNGVGGGETTGGSRFSQWFNREKTPEEKLNDEQSRRLSYEDDNAHDRLINKLLDDNVEPNVAIPGDTDSYFAPISPAANTISMHHRGLSGSQTASKPVDLMEMLQRGKQTRPIYGDVPSVFKNNVVGKVMSLEELEARMLHGGNNNNNNNDISSKQMHNLQQKSEDDATAFKKLIAQVTNQSQPIANGPIPQTNMSIIEMLQHSQKQDEAARRAQMINTNSHPAHLNNDLNFKLQQMQNQVQQRQQMEMLSKLINVGQTNIKTPPLQEMSRELLNRPEAQAILQGLKRGDITPQHLYQQLANTAMQPRHREMLHTILKVQGNGGVGPSPRVLSPVSPHPHPLFQQQQQQQQQQLRVSPLPPNAYCVSPILATSPNTLTVPALHQRIPSPRELQVHTQNIMQRALIKKKLEEQQENYRKKQEMQQRGTSPGGGVSPAKNVSSPTPLTFTPTAVLRKMTADKDDAGKEANKNLEQKMPPGRPLTGVRPQNQQPPQQQQSQPSQQPQQQQPPPNHWNNQFQSLKQHGRPIVKVSNNFSQQNNHEQQMYYQQQQQQHRLFNQQQQQQQQQHQPQRKSGQFSQGMSQTSQGQFPQFTSNHQQFQQLRAQHQQQHHVRSQHQQQQQPHHSQQQPPHHQQQQPPQHHHQQQQQQQQQQHQQQPPFNQSTNWQHMLHNQQQNFDNKNQSGRNDNRNIDLSPTSNQFARWFPPDLLERARNGKLPNLPSSTHNQHAVNLEEIERQTAPAVHN